MNEAGHSKLVIWDNPEGWGGEGGGRGVQDGGTHVNPWLIHVDVWQNHHNIVISLQFKLINLIKPSAFLSQSKRALH